MYINKLFLKEFGKFNNKEIKLDKGLNVLYGEPGAGKSTIRDFVSGILYGMNKTKGLGARGDNFALRKPSGGNGYAGKAQVTNAGKSHLMERNFNMSTDGATLTDIESGKDERLVSKNSYRGVLFDMDKSTFVDAMCVDPPEEMGGDDKALCDRLEKYLQNMKETGCSGINRADAVAYLENEKKKYDNQKYLVQIEELEAQMDELGEVDKELEDIRTARREELDAYNMEIARLKREARQLVNEKDAAIPDEDEDRTRSHIFLDVEALDDDEEFRPKTQKKLTDNIFIIMLTGILVVAAVMLAVHLLNFQKAIQQLFTICTIAFVAVTIIDGLFRKGFFDGADAVPDEAEFDQMIYELGRATESRTVRIEIDRNFQEAHDAKLELLKFKEHDAVAKRDSYYELKGKRDELQKRFEVMEKEQKAIDLAIQTINDISVDIYNDFGGRLNENISEIVSIITDGKYNDVKLDENMHISVFDDDHYMPIEFLSSGTIEQIYLAVRLCIAGLLCKDRMPIIVDDIFTAYDEHRLKNALYCMSRIDTDQVIIFTSNNAIGDMLDDLSMEYNYVEL